eukprot:g28472.t1
MVGDQKVLSFVAYRAQMLYEAVYKSTLGLTDIEEATLRAAVANHFNSPSTSLGDISILGLLQCHNDTTRKLEEQHLLFHPGSLQPDALNMEFTSFKISPHPATSH